MKNKKFSKLFYLGALLYSISMLISHMPFLTEGLLRNFNAFLSGVGVALIILGLIPKEAKEEIKKFKKKLLFHNQ